jgi:hypothetical protein
MVTIRILSETQEEIRSGGGAAVIINTIENRRSEIKQLVIENMKNSLPKTRETIARVLPKLTLAKLYGGNADAEVGMIIDAVLDDVLISLNNREMNRISDEITIEILENTKKNVAKKKWLDTKI